MDIVKGLERLYRKELVDTWFGSSSFINGIVNFDIEFINYLYDTLCLFTKCVYCYGNCQTSSEVTYNYEIVHRMLYGLFMNYLKEYCIQNNISYEIHDRVFSFNNEVISDGNRFFYTIFELDQIVSILKNKNLVSLNRDYKLDLADSFRNNMHRKYFNTVNDFGVMKKSSNNYLFDSNYVKYYYFNKVNEAYNMLKSPLGTEMFSLDYIKKLLSDVRENVDYTTRTMIEKYASVNNIELLVEDDCLILDDEIISYKNHFFYDLLTLENKIKSLTNNKKLG